MKFRLFTLLALISLGCLNGCIVDRGWHHDHDHDFHHDDGPPHY